jgi:glycerate kinase
MRDHITNVMDSSGKSDIVITGDLDYDTLTPKTGKNINQLCKQFQLKSVINTPTRVTDKGESCIDLILVSNCSKVFATGNLSVGFSDHNLVYVLQNMSY